MKPSNGKFFLVIGLLLVAAGIFIFSDDNIIGVIGVGFGVYNAVKGLRLMRGIQPILIRKQQEKHENDQKELANKIKESQSKMKEKD